MNFEDSIKPSTCTISCITPHGTAKWSSIKTNQAIITAYDLVPFPPCMQLLDLFCVETELWVGQYSSEKRHAGYIHELTTRRLLHGIIWFLSITLWVQSPMIVSWYWCVFLVCELDSDPAADSAVFPVPSWLSWWPCTPRDGRSWGFSPHVPSWGPWLEGTPHWVGVTSCTQWICLQLCVQCCTILCQEVEVGVILTSENECTCTCKLNLWSSNI